MGVTVMYTFALKGLHPLHDSAKYWYCDPCEQVFQSQTDSWVQSRGFEMSNMHDWSWRHGILTHIAMGKVKIKCACASHGVQHSAGMVCGVCSHDWHVRCRVV